ncbi:hypothetical protein BLNAU_18988 [Blattamonas nauphoetae]|uniref:Uncharacterized protein n=1 Tax=Blattamonas nauphoetae TaxID=2049346 RepID=A0ABQ9X2Z7_9EUKA|nr:hypothetical protein BLNAU_18988 [Blattamonas nauphoetae]
MLSRIFDDTNGGFDDTDEEFEQLIGRTVSFIIPKGAFVNSVFGQCLSRPSFLTMKTSRELPLTDASILYSSLVARVKQESPFDEAVQDQAVDLLNMLEPKRNERKLADSIIKDLVPSSAGSPSDFIESILTLLSSPHSTVVEAALSFLYESMCNSSFFVRYRLMESDLISKLLATTQTDILPISICRRVFRTLVNIVIYCLQLARPYLFCEFGLTEVPDAFTRREMIFPKVVIPLSQFVAFLISNRFFLNKDLTIYVMALLGTLIEISPFHRPTLEFVVTSPIAFAFSSCLSTEFTPVLKNSLFCIYRSLGDWKNKGPEVVQSGKRMMRALLSEGFEDTLEQMPMSEKIGTFKSSVVECHTLSQKLGSNVTRSQ